MRRFWMAGSYAAMAAGWIFLGLNHHGEARWWALGLAALAVAACIEAIIRLRQ